MTLQDLVERLISHPLYQTGKAAEVKVYIPESVFLVPLTGIEVVEGSAADDVRIILHAKRG